MGNWNGSPTIVALLTVVLAVATSCTAVPDAGPLQAAELSRHAVLIVEVIADAPGYTSKEEISNESITLLNNTQADIDLVGVTISDEHGSWTIPSSVGDTILEPGEKWTVTGPTYNPSKDCFNGICLQNKGECLTLSYGTRELDRWCYPQSGVQGETLRRLNLPAQVVTTSDLSITFWGAAREVQGSCYQISVGETDILVDCGSFMNSGEHDDQVFEFAPSEINGVIITHSHADHDGRLHYLFYQGYQGTVYMTEVTAELYLARLDDTIYYSSIPGNEKESVETAIRKSIHKVEYCSPVTVSAGITATFFNAGHIPGSASISLNIEADGEAYSVLFSGDIGPGYHPFLDPPDYAFMSQDDATVLVIESTYGDTVRDTSDGPYDAFWTGLAIATEETELVVIPALSLDRTQRVLAAIRKGMKEGQLPPDLDVVVGGKSSCYLTEKYVEFQRSERRYRPYFSDEFWAESYLWPRFWTYTCGTNCKGWEDYDADFKKEYDIVVAPSGFGDYSLSKHLIERYVSDPDVAFVKVSWAPDGSPMGQLALVQGQPNATITIEGTTYPIKARLVSVSEAFSGHADQNGLVQYASALPHIDTIVITHGEYSSMLALKSRLSAELDGPEIVVPEYGKAILLGGSEDCAGI